MKIGSLRCCFGEFFFKKGTTFLLSSYALKICVYIYMCDMHICMYYIHYVYTAHIYIMHYNLFTHYKWVLIICLYKICIICIAVSVCLHICVVMCMYMCIVLAIATSLHENNIKIKPFLFQ